MKIEINIDIPTPSFAKFLPHVLLGVWLILIGVGIWQHAAKAVLPPIYDSLTYFQKAKNIWDSVHTGKLFNPFSIAPSFRPPGTVVMSYPFGFNADYRAFYFRSVYLPVLCLVMAIYMAGYSRQMGNSSTWWLATLSIFLSTLPMFYHFEMVPDPPSPGYWGLVDGFLAGVAALAAAAMIRSVKYCSLKWLFAAIFFSGFCMFIKPSGLIVMGLISTSWLLAMLASVRFDIGIERDKEKVKRLIFVGCIVMGAVYAAVIAVSLFSGYMSASNLAYGKAALTVMHDELTLTMSTLLTMLRYSVGFVLPFLFLSIVCGAFLLKSNVSPTGAKWTKSSYVVNIVQALYCIVVGTWFWIVVSGGVTQIRYFFPFPLMAIVVVIPVFFQVVEHMPVRAKFLLHVLLLAAAMNTMILLWSTEPAVAWQRWSGINLSTGLYKAEVEQARSLVDQLRSEGKRVPLYSFFTGAPTAVFENVGNFEDVLHPSQPGFYTRLPVDWQRPSVIRLDELLTSEYVIFTLPPDASSKKAWLALTSPQNFSQEQLLFRALFADLTEKEGVKTVSETDVRLLKIVDSQQLGRALGEKLNKYSWRTVFTDANQARWVSRADVANMALDPKLSVREVKFDNAYMMHAVSVMRKDSGLAVNVWWERLSNDTDKQWYMFFHLIDDKGNIMYKQQLLLPDRVPLDMPRTISCDVISFGNIDSSKFSSLGFGVYSPSSSAFLHTNAGVRDMDNRRVIVPLPRN